MTKDGGGDAQDRSRRQTGPGPPRAAMNGVSDGSVIAASLDDPAAFTPIFHRHWPAIHRFCTSRAGSAGEDLAAETFRVAFDGRARFDRAETNAAPWLFGIATNLIRRFFRSAGREQHAVARLDRAAEIDPSDDALRRVEAEKLGPELAAALAALTAEERDTLLLLAWVDLTYDEIAIALGIPVGTVRSRIHRARTGMRAALPIARQERS